MFFQECNNVTRCCLWRMKRALFLLIFLLVTFVLVSSIFYVLFIQDHANLGSALKNRFSGGADGLGPEHIAMIDLKNKMEVPKNWNSKTKTVLQKSSSDDQKEIQLFGGDEVLNTNILYAVEEDASEEIEAIKLKMISSQVVKFRPIQEKNYPKPSYNVHAFYYAWFGNPEIDNKWYHWNHEYLPNWNKKDTRKMPTGKHVPENGDIGASFYPQLGPYSSRNITLINEHMKMLRRSLIGVISLSWYPPHLKDDHGPCVDENVKNILSAASKFDIKVTFHIEPYKDRNPSNLRDNLIYILKEYGNYSSFYRHQGKPVYYIYDSYLTPPKEWSRLLTSNGDLSVRETELDGIFIGLLVEYKHRNDIKESGFNGFYTYFAANGFCYGSSWKNWRNLANFARKYSLLFIPSVGPGYDDLRVRPWNKATTRLRRNTAYFNTSWRTAISTDPKIVSITSFNEWHEGTQIEPAIPKSIQGYTYNSYSPNVPEVYLESTREWIRKFNLEKKVR